METFSDRNRRRNEHGSRVSHGRTNVRASSCKGDTIKRTNETSRGIPAASSSEVFSLLSTSTLSRSRLRKTFSVPFLAFFSTIFTFDEVSLFRLISTNVRTEAATVFRTGRHEGLKLRYRDRYPAGQFLATVKRLRWFHLSWNWSCLHVGMCTFPCRGNAKNVYFVRVAKYVFIRNSTLWAISWHSDWKL